MSTKESVLGVRLPPELAKEIEAACERLGISKPDLLRMLITRFLHAYDGNGQKVTLPLSVNIGVAPQPPSAEPTWPLVAAEKQASYGTQKKGKPT